MKRRQFLVSACSGLGALALGCNNTGTGSLSNPPESAPLVEGEPLRPLVELGNESAEPNQFVGSLRAAPANVRLFAGTATPMFLYNTSSPGPLIEVTEGQHVRITLDNALAADTTIHWHGLPVPSDQDGNPMDPVHAGMSRAYEYDLPHGSAGTYWYHPHPDGFTAAQVASGLAGALIVRSKDDPLDHLPEVTMLITALRLDPDARISLDDAVDWTVGRQRDLLLVNGARLPVHTIRPGATERWRIVNASLSRHFRLVLDDHAFTLVGTDGGLLGAPLPGLAEILIAPAQRVEVLVTASLKPNATFRLRALKYQADYLGLGTYEDDELLTLATTSEAAGTGGYVPSRLRPIEDLGEASARQRIELSEVANLCTNNGAKVAFLMNGRRFDPQRIDLTTTAGRVELWDIVNGTSMAHPFHIHGTQFQIVSRQAGPVTTPASYLAWNDTVLVPAGQTVTIKTRQVEAGKRMFHCHILEHEDNCMMGILDVQAL